MGNPLSYQFYLIISYHSNIPAEITVIRINYAFAFREDANLTSPRFCSEIVCIYLSVDKYTFYYILHFLAFFFHALPRQAEPLTF